MNYNCPVCQGVLVEGFGDQLNPGDPKHGVFLYCPSRQCPAQEVSGHGTNVKEAWGVIQAKFVTREDRVA
jgi:hypothetical protein